MRVVFLTHNFPRHAGDAAGSFLLRLAHALRDVGVSVRVVAPASAGLAGHDSIEGIDVVRFRYAPRDMETLAYTGTMAEDVRASWSGRFALGGMLLAGAAALRREVVRWNADAVHAHWWFPSALAATVPGATAGRPLFVTSHGSDIRLARLITPAQGLFRRVARRAAGYTFVSRWLLDEAMSLAPTLAGDVAPMPVAVDLFAPPTPGLTRQGLLFVGRLNAQKGILDLIRAAAKQSSADRLTIVGDGPLAAQARDEARTLGITERIEWRTVTNQRDLAALYQRARALVIPSRDEGLGLVGVEAMLCETPVIAYASGGLMDVVHDPKTGRLVAPGDLDGLAAAMDTLSNDDALARQLGAAARPAALERFGPEAVAQRYLALYQRVAR